MGKCAAFSIMKVVATFFRVELRARIINRLNTICYFSFAGGREEANVGESALATPLWGMLYADDVGVVSAITQAVEEDDEGDRGSVRGVWPHRIGGRD